MGNLRNQKISKITSREMQLEYQPTIEFNTTFRTVYMKGGIVFENYKVSRNGIIVGPRTPEGMRWIALNSGGQTYPRVQLRNGIDRKGNIIVMKACFVHIVVAFTYLDEISWKNLPQWILEEWSTYSSRMQELLLTEAFQIDHIETDSSWNPNITNLQFLLGNDNVKKFHATHWGNNK